MVQSKVSSVSRLVRLTAAASLALSVGMGAAVAADKEPVTAGGQVVQRLISGAQYDQAIFNVFGADVKSQTKFPAFRRTNGLTTLGAGAAEVTPSMLDMFDTAGRAVAAQVVDPSRRKVFIPCDPADTKVFDQACASTFFARVGRMLYRRPLTETELGSYLQSARLATEKFSDFYRGIEFGLSGMLVAPQFIYLAEQTETDPKQGLRLTAVSKAMRLSLLLWNSPPDDELLKAAESGEIHTDAGLKRQTDRLLASPRVEQGVRAFFTDMLLMEAFDDVSKDPVIYPAFTVKVATDAREQIYKMLVDHLVVQNGDYRDLFTTRRIFLTQSLGSIYRIPVNAAGSLDWMPYELPQTDPRAGLLSQVGFLAIESHPGRSSPTRRGKALREIFMCQKVPDPPPNVDFSALEDPDKALPTARERLDFHSTNPGCAGCHKITDPIGLALENFDGAGQFRATESGAPIDPSGSLGGKAFKNARELGAVVRDQPAIVSCVVQRAYQYALARNVANDEKAMLEHLKARFAENDYRFPALMREIATSRAFFRVAANTAQ